MTPQVVERPTRRGLPSPSATLYGRVLRLRHTRLRGVVRVLYLEGAVAAGCVLYLADWSSAWVIPALPAAVALAVKIYDVVALATPREAAPSDPTRSDPGSGNP